MRTKFKAYDLNEKEWIDIRYIELRDDGSLWYVQAWDECERDIDPPYFEEDLGKTWVLMQSTGLLDKNGKEIFEGDIVSAMSEGYKAIGVVKRRIDGYWLMYPAWQNGQSWKLVVNEQGNTDVEIIGNRFEHPHLLGED